MDTSTASIAAGEDEEVRPYRIHVSSKYLELTKKKLELTRLPHELLVPRAREWEYGTPKAEIEPLIDFWLEHYTWRAQESQLNNTLPQFRTSIKVEDCPHPLRIHFLHIRSSHQNAIPLLLLPTFPLTNLSLTPLFGQLTNPTSPTTMPAFHIVLPNIPGLGFSDTFQCEDGLLARTAEVFDTLMKRLGYEFYLASMTGAGRESPAGIDYWLATLLGEKYPKNCLGVHLVEPCIERPGFGTGLTALVKFQVAKFFHAGWWGYDSEDFVALKESANAAKHAETRRLEAERPLSKAAIGTTYGAVGMIGLREPNTFSYALCDSPVGLLSLVCSALRKRSPQHSLSNTEIIDVTQLAWLPGPEGAARYWSAAVEEARGFEKEKRTEGRAAVTVFGSDGTYMDYICPAWAKARHRIVFAQRVAGRPGLIAWERADVLVGGIRGLAVEIEKSEGRLKLVALDQVVVAAAEPLTEEIEDALEDTSGIQFDAESPDTIVAVDMS